MPLVLRFVANASTDQLSRGLAAAEQVFNTRGVTPAEALEAGGRLERFGRSLLAHDEPTDSEYAKFRCWVDAARAGVAAAGLDTNPASAINHLWIVDPSESLAGNEQP